MPRGKESDEEAGALHAFEVGPFASAAVPAPRPELLHILRQLTGWPWTAEQVELYERARAYMDQRGVTVDSRLASRGFGVALEEVGEGLAQDGVRARRRRREPQPGRTPGGFDPEDLGDEYE